MTRAVFSYYSIVVKVHQNTKKEKVQKGKKTQLLCTNHQSAT